MKSEKTFDVPYGKTVQKVTGKPVVRNLFCPSCDTMLPPSADAAAKEGKLVRDERNKRHFYACPCGQSFVVPWKEGWYYAIPSMEEMGAL